MTQINYTPASEEAIDELSEPVVMEKSELEDLRTKADRAEELDDRLDDVNSTLDELADHKELLDEVDEDKIDELREADGAVVLPDDEYDELTGLVDEIGEIFADELSEYSPFDADELQEKFTPLELREKVEEHEEASIASELGASDTDPDPDGGSANPEELSADDMSVEGDTEEEVRNTIAEQLEADGMSRQAEKVREGQIGLDKLGVDV